MCGKIDIRPPTATNKDSIDFERDKTTKRSSKAFVDGINGINLRHIGIKCDRSMQRPRIKLVLRDQDTAGCEKYVPETTLAMQNTEIPGGSGDLKLTQNCAYPSCAMATSPRLRIRHTASEFSAILVN